jgi:hypothetical protein
LINLGFQTGKKCYTAKIPEEILNSNKKEAISAVIRGIFDTDGCFYCKKSYGKYDKPWTKTHHTIPRIMIQIVSEKLSFDIMLLLNKLGIEYKSDMRIGSIKSNKNCSNSYRIHIWKLSEIDKWFNIIGSHNPRQITRYAVWKKIGYLPPQTTLEYRKKLLNEEN